MDYECPCKKMRAYLVSIAVVSPCQRVRELPNDIARMLLSPDCATAPGSLPK